MIIETKPRNKKNLQWGIKHGQEDKDTPLRSEKKCKSGPYNLIETNQK